MNAPAKLHKLTVFSQILNELQVQTLADQNSRYPLRLNQMPDTMTALIGDVEGLLPDIKRIIEK